MGSTNDSSKLNRSKNNKEDDVENLKSRKLEEEAQASVKPKASSPSAIPAAASAGGGSGRLRHDSNSSCDSARSPSTDRMKRRRTTSLSSSPLSSFFFPPPPNPISHSPSSPSFSPYLSSSPSSTFVSSSSTSGGQSPMSLDEVLSAVNGVTNMALAHEIALDNNFKLEKFEPPQASLEKQVRDVMHQAFWDNLREQLGQDPPQYCQAFVLLQEVRQQLLELTLPHQLRLRQQISDKLDLELITQQAEHQVLNFSEYSSYVVELMGKLCAPVRDEAIRKLRLLTDPVEVFKGVAETLDLMKLDMANYTIQMIRPTIVKHIVEYERGKFKEFLATQKDGLELTRNWILKHVDSLLLDVTTAAGAAQPAALLADPLALRGFCNSALNSAYMELLQWPQDELLPETVCVDRERVLELRDRLHQVCLLAAVLLVSLNTATHSQPSLAASHDALRAELKRDLCPILDPAYTQEETLAALPNLTEQVVASLQKHLERSGARALDTAVVAALRAQLTELQQPQHRVTSLVTARCLAFLRQILGNANARNVAVPAPFVVLQEEVARICGGFLRFSQHNRAVFGEFYFDMAEERLKASAGAPGKSLCEPPASNGQGEKAETGVDSDKTGGDSNKNEANSDKTDSNVDKTDGSPDEVAKDSDEKDCDSDKSEDKEEGNSEDNTADSPCENKSQDGKENNDNKAPADAGVRWDSLDLD